MKIKPTQIYGWESEPVDERPSEFNSSAGYSVLSGYHPMKEPTHPGRAHSRFGFKALLASCVVVLALGVFALAKLASLLRG